MNHNTKRTTRTFTTKRTQPEALRQIRERIEVQRQLSEENDRTYRPMFSHGRW